jgi:hypothetical protein
VPVINDNSFAKGQQAGANVLGAYKQAADVAMAMQRMDMAEKQFKAELAMKDRVFKLREQEFQVSSRLHAQQLAASQFKLAELEKTAKAQEAANKAAPGALTALGNYVSAQQEGKPKAAAAELDAVMSVMGANPSLAPLLGQVGGLLGVPGLTAAAVKAANTKPGQPVLGTGPSAAAAKSMRDQGFLAAGVSDDAYKASQSNVTAERNKLRSSLAQLSSIASAAGLSFVANSTDAAGQLRLTVAALLSKKDPKVAAQAGPLGARILQQVESVENAEAAVRQDDAKRFASEQASNQLFTVVQGRANDDTIARDAQAASVGIGAAVQKRIASTIDEVVQITSTNAEIKATTIAADRAVGEDQKRLRSELISKIKPLLNNKKMADAEINIVMEALLSKFFVGGNPVSTTLPPPGVTGPPKQTLENLPGGGGTQFGGPDF